MKCTKRDGKRRRVVVTGMGIISPIGTSVTEFWDNAVAGKSGIRTAEFRSVQGFQSKVAGQVPGFDPRSFGIGERQIRRLDRYAQFALAAAAQAFESSG